MGFKKWICSLLVVTLHAAAFTSEAPNRSTEVIWSHGAYLGPIEVSLESSDKLYVQIETKDLLLRSVN